jgi:hypothetical protein
MRPAARLFGLGWVSLALLLAGCGSGSPTSASSIFSVAGNWTGTWQFVSAGATVTDGVTATLTQDGLNAKGTWTADSGPSGQVSFTVAASLSGTLTISQTTLTGQSCSATTTLSGAGSATALDFTLTAIPPSGLCQWATSNQFSLKKK